ncbi:ski2-like helicase [Legionella sainthelensi]|uniref:Ski2-like helicase n=1 Tax=Legionella sainthelensi TaxID=28087 RepID=A0A0W0YE58_9GAMM|nr:DEAD/DEAH box helicase [Legionella sainthelensi]KTD54819.1 ski2-like helicase [Legionella sainthelensi]VEH37444.1 ski2-like helicase [Legionella sainthelensi]
MRPEQKSKQLLSITRSKSKMLEYSIPEEHHIRIPQDPFKLFTLSIGLLGDLASSINREKSDSPILSELRENLLFSTHFFDSYLQSKLNETLDPYFALLGSASYYLCNLPGSALLLANRLNEQTLDLDAEGLENLLLWLLQANLKPYLSNPNSPFRKYIDNIASEFVQFFKNGTGEENLINLSVTLKKAAYEFGTPRQLLFGDIIGAVIRVKLENSTWKSLPLYSALSLDKWLPTLEKESFIKELWPAQHLLGKANVLKGESAIVQMPTSAGKTKAIELILRSSFLSNRITLAIIIAPFRALCHEIKNSLTDAFHNENINVDELSDTPQTDFEIAELLGHQQILIITPEKFLYVLRHSPELASMVGLLVFDEGHQFDSGTRGITYELLLTSLRSMISEEAQKVLISAVISNAETIGKWLNNKPTVVEGSTLNPTFKSLGFASWLDPLGKIEYVDIRNTEQSEFYVPRVIERLNLGKKVKEKTDRYFPEKTGQDIALYLGLKLAHNGSVAIFCGKKTTAASICKRAVECIKRSIPLPIPLEFSNQEEVDKLYNLHIKNLGSLAPASISAKHGIFTHHNNTPHGIRLAVEHAMRENLVKFVICTSTLAQGVNLPIRYLIITSVYQGTEQIKVRDFHNLIGRAGRAGMYTEGSILFADPIVYDKKLSRYDSWRWKVVKDLIDPTKSEECVSSLSKLIPLIIQNDRNKSNDKKDHSLTWDILSFAKAYIKGWDSLNEIIIEIEKSHNTQGFTEDALRPQFESFSIMLSSIEGFLLSNWGVTDNELSEVELLDLTKQTLAYFLAEDKQREQLQELFKILAKNISTNITDINRRKVFGKTLYGVNEAQAIERWVQLHTEELITVKEEEFIELIWPLFNQHIHSKTFRNFNRQDVLMAIAKQWFLGVPFHELFKISKEQDCKLGKGKKPRKIKIENIIDICEGGLSYDGALVINAVCEFYANLDCKAGNDVSKRLQFFQKRIKYGLPTEASISFYELGFADRVICQDLAMSINLSGTRKKECIKTLKQNSESALILIKKYPHYFQERMNELLR